MAFDKAAALKDIDRVLAHRPRGGVDNNEAFTEQFVIFSQCIRRWAPPAGSHAQCLRTLEAKGQIYSYEEARAAVRALRADIEADAIGSFEELVHADLFSDFLAQATSLNSQSYRRAAAVVAGGALEEHLRQLSRKHGLATHTSGGEPLKASGLNSALYGAQVYTKAEQAQTDAWQKIRNDAAHATTSFEADFDQRAITRYIDGIRDFMVKYPA